MKKFKSSFILIALLISIGCEDDKPVTLAEPKLHYYIESYNTTDLGFLPQLKVVYEYDDVTRKLSKYTVFSYNPDQTSFTELRYFNFHYVNDQLDKIKGYLPEASTPYIEYTYHYSSDMRLLKIMESNTGTGINIEANFTYPTDESMKVAFTFSNGGFFEYEVHYSGGNVSNDKTTRGSQLCSDGEYTYDDHVNPFNHLGYVDYMLTNLSANNKLTENVNYVGCAFPSLIPESYSYEYNDIGYPISITTHYKGRNTTSKKEIFYK